MNSLIYSFLHKHSVFIYPVFLSILFFTLFSVLPEKLKAKITFYFKKILPIPKCKYEKYNSKLLCQQWQMLIGVLMVNVFAVLVYDDFYRSLLYLSITISIFQIIAIIKFFINKSIVSSQNLVVPFVLGFLSIVLAFTHIYFYLFVNLKSGFTNFDYQGMNSNRLSDWLNCLFYTISLIIPYPLTDLSPNEYWMKLISLLQIIIFYVFIYRKLAILFDKNKID